MPEINLREVLERVAKLTNAETDKAVAAVFGVPFETLSTWKKRNKIPYEQLCDLAERSGTSLYYLLLGKKETRALIDLTIYKEIQRALKSKYSIYRGLGSELFSYHAAVFYNQYADIEDSEQRKRRMLLALLLIDKGTTEREGLDKYLESSPEFSKMPGAQELLQKFRDNAETHLKKIQALLEDEDKFRAAMTEIWGQPNEPESGGAVETKEKPSAQLRPVASRQTASRDTAPKGRKKKKK